MTREDAVTRLKNWGNFMTLVTELDEEIRDLRRSIEYNRNVKAARIDGMPKNKSIKKPTEETAIKNIEKLETEIKCIENQIVNLKINKDETEEFLNTLEAIENKLIRMRYVRKKNWQAVSLQIYLSIRQCYRVHNKILDKMCKYFGEGE